MDRFEMMRLAAYLARRDWTLPEIFACLEITLQRPLEDWERDYIKDGVK